MSSHYFVYENGSIVQLVPEARRAWHAGVSSWAGETDINSRSIGIEIVNPGHDFGYPDFPIRQIAAVIALCRGIIARRAIRARPRAGAFRRRAEPQAGSRREISLAPARRIRRRPVGRAGADHRLAVAGAGRHRRDRDRLAEVARRITATACRSSGDYDEATKDVVTAFQRHFRPAQIDGMADTSTRETLRKLLEARKVAGQAGSANDRPQAERPSRRLDAGGPPPHTYPVSRLDGRSGNHRKVAGEESPGSTDERCRITSGGA